MFMLKLMSLWLMMSYLLAHKKLSSLLFPVVDVHVEGDIVIVVDDVVPLIASTCTWYEMIKS